MKQGIRLLGDADAGAPSPRRWPASIAPSALRSGLPIDEVPVLRYGLAACWLNRGRRADATGRHRADRRRASSLRRRDRVCFAACRSARTRGFPDAWRWRIRIAAWRLQAQGGLRRRGHRGVHRRHRDPRSRSGGADPRPAVPAGGGLDESRERAGIRGDRRIGLSRPGSGAARDRSRRGPGSRRRGRGGSRTQSAPRALSNDCQRACRCRPPLARPCRTMSTRPRISRTRAGSRAAVGAKGRRPLSRRRLWICFDSARASTRDISRSS